MASRVLREQWLAYLDYKLVTFAPVATPLAYLGLAFAITTLGLGRCPGPAAPRQPAVGAR